MSFLIFITPQADKDEKEAYNYYEDKAKGLGKDFLKEVEKKQ